MMTVSRYVWTIVVDQFFAKSDRRRQPTARDCPASVPSTAPPRRLTMPFRLLADLVLVLHFAFVLFVVLGGLLVVKWRPAAWVHVPIFVYGTLIEFVGWICPLTPLENSLRTRAGGTAYDTSFIEHYIAPIIYPAGFTYRLQVILGILVLMINLALYGWIAWRAGASGRSLRKIDR